MKEKLSTSKTALVTGGAKRIGKAICLKLAELGFDIALHYASSKKEADETARLIKQSGQKCTLFRCDLSKPAQAEKLIPQVIKKRGSLDLLINSASLFETSSLKNISSARLKKDFETNLFAPILLTKSFAQSTKKGQVIHLLDTHITDNTTDHLSYLLTKKGLADFTKLAAVKLGPNIRVNAIAPGLILAPEKSKKGHLEQRAKKIPAKQKGSPDSITQAVEYLIKNTFVTGEILFCDGGEHLI